MGSDGGSLVGIGTISFKPMLIWGRQQEKHGSVLGDILCIDMYQRI